MFVQRKEALQFEYVEEISNNAENILLYLIYMLLIKQRFRTFFI